MLLFFVSSTFYSQHTKLVKWLDSYDIHLAFNPGSFHLRKGAKSLTTLLKRVSVLFLNKEEAQQFARTKTTHILTLCKKLKRLGPEIVVITDGAKGSYAYDGEQLLFQDIFPVPVIERTGCGDSYATGFMVALFKGYSWKQAMQWGTLNAASVLQHTGPQAGTCHCSLDKKKYAE